MKYAIWIMLAAVNGWCGQEKSGADRIELLFIEAQEKAALILNQMQFENIDKYSLKPMFKDWLKSPAPTGGTRFGRLRLYSETMDLDFQNEACMTDEGPRGTCFDNSDPEFPKMIVSYELNQLTTLEQAIGMVIHEAGHGASESNHKFLSAMGLQLAQYRFGADQLLELKIGAYQSIWDSRFGLRVVSVDLEKRKFAIETQAWAANQSRFDAETNTFTCPAYSAQNCQGKIGDSHIRFSVLKDGQLRLEGGSFREETFSHVSN